MDYSELFYTEKQKIIDQEAISLKVKLSQAREEDLNFTDVLNEVNNYYYNHVEKQKDKSTREGKVHKVFIEGISKYRGELDNQIINSINKYLYKYYDKNSTGFESYEDVVITVAKIEGLNSVKRTFSIESQFFEDMYELNNFKHFTLNISNYPYSDEWKKVHLKRFPEKQNLQKKEPKKNYQLEIEQTNLFLNSFDDDEKIILLKAFYRYTIDRDTRREYMPLTEFIKLNFIISRIEQPDIFYMTNASDSNIYSRVKSKKFSQGEKSKMSNIVEKLRSQSITTFADYIAMKKVT